MWLFQRKETPPIEKESITLTPLNEFAVPYVTMKLPDEGPDFWLSWAPGAIQKCKSDLQKRLDAHIKIIPYEIPVPIGVHNIKQRKVKVIITIYNKLQIKIHRKQEELLHFGINCCNELEQFAQNAINNKIAIKIDYTGFCKALIQHVTQNSEIQLMKKHSTAFYKLAKYPANDPIPTESQIKTAISNVLNLFDSSEIYMPISTFDDIFADYLQKYSDNIDSILKCMESFDYIQAHERSFQLIKSIALSLNIPAKLGNGSNDYCKEYIILICSFFRYFYEKVEILIPYLLNNSFSAPTFIENAETIRNLTVRQLSPENTKFFMNTQLNAPLKDVFYSNELFRYSMDQISSMPFYSSPIDITAAYSYGLHKLNKQIITASHFNKFGNTDLTQDEIARGEIEFDKIFTYAHCAMAVNPPPNAMAISTIVKSFGNFQFSASLEYASTTVVGAIQYIADFKNE